MLVASASIILAACQTPPPQPGDGQAESAASTPTAQSTEQAVSEDQSSATANADGSPIIFDPVEAGKNLPDPCLELSEETMNRIGFTGEFQRFTYGLDDELLGKGISCDFDLIEDTGLEVITLGFYTDNVSKEYIKDQGFFIRDVPESKVPNAYFYTFSPWDQSTCFIGAHTPRGRLGLVATGPTTWTWEESCPLALKYFDKTYGVTDGFAWLQSSPDKDERNNR
ncbi:hypothetical protein M0E84_03280 [Corynebacterium sp. CCM 9186]|uniref:hypothetical protein n=1 Tax=Corynebacterium meridianum TaxID=2765363 RepID=UPI002005A397|nr:hypothetical protein [Corynebacterium meridianum]MCK7677065.1 hypothetical protein [Corynebacterium meridianum]